MRAAATLCDWLSGRRRCSVSRPVRDELAGSADSDVDNGIGGRVRGAKIFETGGVSTTWSPGPAAGRSVPKRMSTVAVTSY